MPINGWNKSSEQLLENWSRQISINENEYRKRGTYYRNWYYAFGLFEVIAGTGGVITLINVIINIVNNQDDCEQNVQLGLLIFIAVLESIIVVAQGIDKFFNFGSGSEQYYDAAKEHNALCRLIDTTLTLPRVNRDQAREVLLSVRHQFDQIQDNSPNLPPNDIIHRLHMCIYENPEQAKGVRAVDCSASSSNMLLNIVGDRNSPRPNGAQEVELPESPPEENKEEDEENISNGHQCKFNQRLREKKKEVIANEIKRRPSIFKPLEYQWRRMQQHEEDPSNEPQGDEQV